MSLLDGYMQGVQFRNQQQDRRLGLQAARQKMEAAKQEQARRAMQSRGLADLYGRMHQQSPLSPAAQTYLVNGGSIEDFQKLSDMAGAMRDRQAQPQMQQGLAAYINAQNPEARRAAAANYVGLGGDPEILNTVTGGLADMADFGRSQAVGQYFTPEMEARGNRIGAGLEMSANEKSIESRALSEALRKANESDRAFQYQQERDAVADRQFAEKNALQIALKEMVSGDTLAQQAGQDRRHSVASGDSVLSAALRREALAQDQSQFEVKEGRLGREFAAQLGFDYDQLSSQDQRAADKIAVQMRGQDLGQDQAVMRDATTRRGQDIGLQEAVMRDATTQRGQDMTLQGVRIRDDTARRGQDIGLQETRIKDATSRRGQDFGQRQHEDMLPIRQQQADAAVLRASRPDTVVTNNMGGNGVDYGKPEAGLAWARNPDGTVRLDERGAPVALPYEGGSVQRENAKSAQAARMANLSYEKKYDLVNDKIDEAIGLAQTFGTTGIPGAVARNIPGTDALKLRNTIDTIKANLGFEELQAIREASPTGGALGQVTERELDFLQAASGKLDQAESGEELIAVLQDIQKRRGQFRLERARALNPGYERYGTNAEGRVIGFDGSEWVNLY